MRIVRVLSLVNILFLLFFCRAAYPFDDHDFQVWHTEVQEAKIDARSKLQIQEEVRFGDNAGTVFYQQYDLLYMRAINDIFSAGLGYRQIFESKKKDFKEENQPYLYAKLLWKPKGTELESRSRLEYRHFDYQSDFWRYRNKITVRSPWKFTKLEIQPYLSEEGFISWNNAVFNQNRFYAGFAMKLTKSIKAELYYLLQSVKSTPDWVYTNVLGSQVKVSF